MGRTAAILAILVAVGGCVSDDPAPLAQYPTAKPGQNVPPTYPSWDRGNGQFAATQDDAVQPAAHVTSTTPAVLRAGQTTTQKPAAPLKPAAAPAAAVTKLPPPDPTPVSSDVVVDSQLVAATMVTSGSDKADKTDKADKSDKTDAGSSKKAPAAAQAGVDVDAAPSDPSAPSIRMVNSKRITLNYELKDVGASGVSGVELWVTQASQESKVWKKGEIVAQTNHAFTVEVKDEGLYGFTLLARNGSGVGKDAPAAGEQPQVWVMVDVTKPSVQISSVEISRTAKEPTVEVHWAAKDKNLGPRPITLSYSEQPEGPWTPIAAGVENSGQYEWTPAATVPHRIYLKVEAVDMPGNTASAQTANPLRLDVVTAAPPPPPAADAAHKTLPAPPALDTSRPTAAIMGVEPGGN